MREENTNFYKALGIDLKGREPETIHINEIEAAYKKAEEAHAGQKREYGKKAKTLHPDIVRNSDEAKKLKPDELKNLIAEKTKEFTRATEQWERDKENLRQAENALKGLKDPHVRARHDERLKNSYQRSSTHYARPSPQNESRTSGTNQTRPAGSAWGSDFAQTSKQKNDAFRTKLKDFIDAKRKESVKPDLRDFDLSFHDLSGMDLEGCAIKKPLFATNLKGANLKNTDFSDQTLWDCAFDETTQLEGTNFSKARFSRTSLPKNLKNINFESVHFFTVGPANLSGKVFENCNFNNAKLGFAIKDTTFKDCSFKRSEFSFNKIENVVFEGGHFHSSLEYAELSKVTFKNVSAELLDLTSATLKDIKLEGPIKGLKLKKEQLKYVDLTKATVSKFKVVDFFGQEIEDPFRKSGSKAAAGGTTENIERNAGKEHGFFERIVRNAEGKVHSGKVITIIAGTAIVGAIIYELSKRKKPWTEQVEARNNDESATLNR